MVGSFQAILDLASWTRKQPWSGALNVFLQAPNSYGLFLPSLLRSGCLSKHACALKVPIRRPNQHDWLLPSLPHSGVLNGQATLILRFQCSTSRSQSAWLAPSKPSSILHPGWAGNLDPLALNVPIWRPSQHGRRRPSLPWSGLVSAQATLILRFVCSFSSAKLIWLAPSKPYSIWLSELAGNLDPALCMRQFENAIRMVGCFQAFLDLASWMGKQPWSCVSNVLTRVPNQHGWLLPSLPRSGLLSGQWMFNANAWLRWLTPSKPSSIWLHARAGNLDPAAWMFQFDNQISLVGSFQAFLDLASRQPWSCAPNRKPNQHGLLLLSLLWSGILSDGQPWPFAFDAPFRMSRQATLILRIEGSNSKTQKAWLAPSKPSSIWRLRLVCSNSKRLWKVCLGDEAHSRCRRSNAFKDPRLANHSDRLRRRKRCKVLYRGTFQIIESNSRFSRHSVEILSLIL